MPKKAGSVSFVYEEPPTRPVIPVSGAYGGPSPDGSSVVANVYAEFGTVPSLEEQEVSPEGRVDTSKASRITRGDVTRLVLATLVFSPEVAIRVGKWLTGHGEAARDHRKANQP